MCTYMHVHQGISAEQELNEGKTIKLKFLKILFKNQVEVL